MAKASARHILVESEESCLDLKQQIEDGADFAEVAAANSKCPSGQQGGALGEFSLVFNEEVGKVHGPVKTDFGYHLIEITDRTD